MSYRNDVWKRSNWRMWAWGLTIALLLSLGHAACATDSRTSPPVTEARQILWKVQSPLNTIYLAGSIHVLQKNHYPLHHLFDDAFNESSKVIFEVDLDELSSPLAQMSMLRKGMYLNGETLDNVLSPESYAVAKETLAIRGLNIQDFHRMKPWMMATAIMALELQKSGFENALGVDHHYFKKAQADGKSIQGLETVEFQLDLFDALSLSVQEQFLLQTLEDIQHLDTQVSEIVEAWKQGNVEELENLLIGMREYPELNQAFVIDRNRDWLPHIELALQEKEPVFIVVGALHLLGKEGLVSVLKGKGYRVEQL